MKTTFCRAWIFLILYLSVSASGLILPVSAQTLGINSPVSALVSQVSISQHAMLEFSLISILLPYLLSVLFLSIASDKWGRIPAVKLCLQISSFGYLFLLIGIYVQSIYLPLIGMTCFAIGSGSVPIIQAWVVDLSQGERKSYYFAVTAAIFSVAYIPSAQLSNHLLLAFPKMIDLKTVTYFALMLNLFSLLLHSKISKNYSCFWQKDQFTIDDVSNNLMNVLANRKICNLLLLLFLFQFSWGLYLQNIYYYLSQYPEYPAHQACLFITYLLFLSAGFLIYVYPHLLRFWRMEKLLFYSFLTCCMAFLLNILSVNAIAQYSLGFFIAASVGMIMAICWNLLSNAVDQCNQGFLMGITGIIWIISWAFSSALAGYLNTFYLTLPLQVAGIVMLFAGLLSWFLKNKSRVIASEH